MLVAPSDAVRAEPGDTVRLSASVLDAQGRPAPGAVVRWTSADTTVATVDASGLVAAVSAGSTTVTATAGSGASASVAVTTRFSNTADDRAALTALYEATDGPNWTENDNWLTDAPLYLGTASIRTGEDGSRGFHCATTAWMARCPPSWAT